MTFFLGVMLGLFIGATVGVLALALCRIEEAER